MKIQTHALDELIKKWVSFFSGSTSVFAKLSNNKAKSIAIILNNQEKYLDELDGKMKGSLEDCIGDSYKYKILYGIAQAASRSDIWDLISVQPMTNCVSKVFYFDRANLNYSGDMPEVRIDIKSKDVRAITRRTGSHIRFVENKYGRDSLQDYISAEFTKAFSSFRREAISDLFCVVNHQSGPGRAPIHIDNLLGAVMNASIEVHKSTMRGPANKIICHPKHSNVLSLLDDKFDIFSDWKFPEDKVLLYYSGPSILDQPYVYAPYMFPLWSGYQRIEVVSRHAKYLVCQEAIALVSIED